MFKRKKRLRNHKRAHRKKVFVLFTGVVLFIGIGLFVLFTFHHPFFSTTPNKILAAYTERKTDPESLVLLKKLLIEKQIAFTKISIGDSSYTVSLSDGSEVVFSTQKDIFLQMSSLQFILSRLTMEGKLFKQLDLRFDKPVIVVK